MGSPASRGGRALAFTIIVVSIFSPFFLQSPNILRVQELKGLGSDGSAKRVGARGGVVKGSAVLRAEV